MFVSCVNVVRVLFYPGALLTVFCTFSVIYGLSLLFVRPLSLSSLLAFSVYRSPSSPHAPADSTDTSDWLCGQDAGEQ